MRAKALSALAALCLVAPAVMAADPAPELTQADATGVLSRMVTDADGRDVGRVVDVLIDPAGQPRAVVVDAGGFMGLGSRRIAVGWTSVHVPPPGAPDPKLRVDLTDAQIQAAPEYSDRTKPATVVGPPPGTIADPTGGK